MAPFSQPGRNLVVAGYALYSSSTELVMALPVASTSESAVFGFTLNPRQRVGGGTVKEMAAAFQLSRREIQCPSFGPYYSLNEAREPDWPQGLKDWVSDAKRGQTTLGRTHSSRYICSLCGDFHRTLLVGGWAGNPRPHLRLLYEAAPLAFVVEAAGGRGSNGQMDLLDISPQGLHDRTCVFLGSTDNIEDLLSYKDIQQGSTSYKA